LDLDESGSLTCEEFATLMRRVRPDLNDRQLAAVFKKVDEDEGGTLSIGEFVEGVERIVTLLSREKRPLTPTPLRQRMLDQIIEQKWFRKLTLWFIMLDVWIFSMYGYANTVLLNTLGGLVCLVFVLELALRVYAHSPQVYWNYNLYHKGGVEVQFAHRVDSIVIVLSAIGFLVVIGTGYNGYYFFLVLPIVRVFTKMKDVRHLFYVLSNVAPLFWPQLVFLLLIFYVYARIGMYMFGGKLAILGDDAPDSTFDTFGRSIITLFQLLIGAAWSDLMYSCIYVTSWSNAWFSLTFAITVNALFTNTFLGLILGRFGDELDKADEDELEDEDEDEKKPVVIPSLSAGASAPGGGSAPADAATPSASASASSSPAAGATAAPASP